jgi:hypothetical protein
VHTRDDLANLLVLEEHRKAVTAGKHEVHMPTVACENQRLRLQHVAAVTGHRLHEDEAIIWLTVVH